MTTASAAVTAATDFDARAFEEAQDDWHQAAPAEQQCQKAMQVDPALRRDE